MNIVNNFINYVKDNYLGEVFTDHSFKDLTTLKIGGHITCLYRPNTLDDLYTAFKYIIENNVPYFILGNGSNILVSDEEQNKVVINIKEINRITQISNELFIVGAGITTCKLAFELAKSGYTNHEFLSVIPGTLGGAIYMNAGAYNFSISDIIKDVTYLTDDGRLVTLNKDELDFRYRYSAFQGLKGIIVFATLKLKKSPIKDMPLEKIATFKKEKKNTQPINVYSAGSTFKNSNTYNAWEVIDKLGFRGYIYNDVMVSNIHTNYIINIGNATFDDAITLINTIKRSAKEELNINLECEWEIIN